VRPWRGARDERYWPKFLIWGETEGEWPWVNPDHHIPAGSIHQAPDE
jgi:hypothetical protein